MTAPSAAPRPCRRSSRWSSSSRSTAGRRRNSSTLRLQDGRLFGSLIDVLNRGTPVALLALGMALVIATRGIDLSVGAVMAIRGAVAASRRRRPSPGRWRWRAALGAGLVCGLWNGLLVAVLGMQPIVATLILMVAGRGIAQLITEGRIVTFTAPIWSALGNGAVLGLPMPVAIALAHAVLDRRGGARHGARPVHRGDRRQSARRASSPASARAR